MSAKKQHSVFKRNGFHTTTSDGFLNTENIPKGYNWALGYTEQSTNEVIAVNHSKNVYMDEVKRVSERGVRPLNK